MDKPVDVVIIGAGPYGLSLAAHLRAAGTEFRQFGIPMRLWRTSMPHGMFLKSQGFASNLSDPESGHTLREFCATTGREYADYGLPVALDTFVAYADWFRGRLVPDIEEVLVTEVIRVGGRYRLTLSDGERVRANRVVVAAGVEHFAHLPGELADLPPELCSHASAHADLGVFRGRDCVVVGAGQSAMETAALLHENGAGVRLVVRRPALRWNGDPLESQRSVLRRLREPEAPLGSGWRTWFYSARPDLYFRLPTGWRLRTARTALGPAGAFWLRRRVEARLAAHLNHIVRWAEPDGSGVRLGGHVPGSGDWEVKADHIVAGTGYRTDLQRLSFLSESLRAQVRTLGGTPAVGRDFQSSVPGLYFVGPAVAPTFGPVMRFVYGADFAARSVVRHLGRRADREREPVRAGR